MLYIHIYAIYNELNEGINHTQWNNGNECARVLHEPRNASHNSREKGAKGKCFIARAFHQTNIMLISPGQERRIRCMYQQCLLIKKKCWAEDEEAWASGNSMSSRKSKIYDDGIVVMQCASQRVATSHKFSLTIIFSFYLPFA